MPPGTGPALYDPAEYAISFMGNIASGFAEGTFISIERTEDSVMMQVGTDGEVAIARNRNRSGTIKFTLQQTSSFNDVLANAHALFEAGGGGIGPFFLQDGLGTSNAHAAYAWVVKPPALEGAKELGNREWTLATGKLDVRVGGSLAVLP